MFWHEYCYAAGTILAGLCITSKNAVVGTLFVALYTGTTIAIAIPSTIYARNYVIRIVYAGDKKNCVAGVENMPRIANMRKPRNYEYTCRCRAYKFPHRFGGGKCNGYCVVYEAWNQYYGRGECFNCNCLVDGECQVINGIEKPKNADCLISFKETEGIR